MDSLVVAIWIIGPTCFTLCLKPVCAAFIQPLTYCLMTKCLKWNECTRKWFLTRLAIKVQKETLEIKFYWRRGAHEGATSEILHFSQTNLSGGGGVSEITKGMNNLNAWGITNTNLVVLTNCLHCTVHAMKNVLNQGLFFFCINNY